MRCGFGASSLRVLRALVLAVLALALTVTRPSFARERLREVTSLQTCAGTLETCTRPGAPR